MTWLRHDLVASWLPGYRRDWLVPDVLAGLIVWSVVVPQACAYAQIAGLPPSAGLAAAPGALVAYALLGTSRSLIVSATTATSALSAAVVAVGQLPKLFGVPAGSGGFFSQLWDLLGELGDTDGWTLAVGAAAVAALVLLDRFAPKLPAFLLVLVGSIVVSALLDLSSRGVEVVGELPDAAPDFAIPDVGWSDLDDLLPAALGMMIVTAEAAAVSRSIASTQGYAVDVNRDITALGSSNLVAGLSSGFVQSGGASQTLAGERAGAKTQLVSLVAAGLVLLTGLFLAFLFEDLPQATLAAIVIVAISGFFRVDELRRFARLRRSAVMLALVALVGVLVFGVLPGLLIAVALSLIELMGRLSRPPVAVLARDPSTEVWGNRERHPGWETTSGTLALAVEGPLFYANSETVKRRVLDVAETADPRPSVVVLDLVRNDELDVQGLDTLGELVDELAGLGIELRLAGVHAHALGMLRTSGLADRVRTGPTLDGAVRQR
jgi:sulfate permease, SulP family